MLVQTQDLQATSVASMFFSYKPKYTNEKRCLIHLMVVDPNQTNETTTVSPYMYFW